MNRAAHVCLLALLPIALSACQPKGGDTAASPDAAPLRLDDARARTSYMVGLDLAKQVAPVRDEVDIETVVAALRAAHAGRKPQLDEAQIAQIRKDFVRQLQDKRKAEQAVLAKKNLERGREFLAENGAKPGIVKTASGLQYQIVRDAKGAKPDAASTVRVNYIGAVLDGKEFENTYAIDHPSEFPLSQIMPGLREGLMLMPTGSKYRFWIPAAQGYGEVGVPGQVEPNATLVFDVELLEIAG
ncbi:FKBP-type peptidyl-prolyl cis-trans isomerase [Lysobacter sp. cf310]|uniref:FKBP-type peptidyl-prolyl cis-trans isomerase n=1 Tax=Lysobacter sp. cf310 TaxID=1761790 RepID=UPI0008F24359|nr:FKBP-type peptidyl-prolyl cis-trans isomerase [Lysobacter sp. cf310]SFK73773.1 FKBP-type peptidyl-prolyl cis-trans isomerase FkpA [Lysobacter sp. cf310]